MEQRLDITKFSKTDKYMKTGLNQFTSSSLGESGYYSTLCDHMLVVPLNCIHACLPVPEAYVLPE
jgi:hypothetical protein